MSETLKRRLPAFLIGSVILNSLLIGLLIGGGLRGQGSTPPPPDRGESALVRSLERSLPEDERANVRDAMREAYRATRNERRTLRQARRALREALAADPYDKVIVEKAFQTIRQAEAASIQGLHEELARQFERLSPDQRAALARSMDHPLRRDHHGDGRGERRGEGRDRPEQPLDPNEN